MGLLDEAIREHLELKRRRGADAGEISRAETEALGPVRRAPDGTPDLTSISAPESPAQQPAAYDEVAPGHDAEPGWEDETAARIDDPPPAYEPPPIPAAPAPGPGYVMPPAVPPPPTYDEPPPVPAAPDPGPGYVMPPAVPPPPAYDEDPPAYDEHPPGFEGLDDPIEAPPAEPPRGKRGLRLRLRRHSAGDEPAPPPPPPPPGSSGRPRSGGLSFAAWLRRRVGHNEYSLLPPSSLPDNKCQPVTTASSHGFGP
jgi:hypothetical protein